MSSEYAVYDEQFPTDNDSLHSILNHFVCSDDFLLIEKKDTHRVIGFISLNCIDEITSNLGYCIHTKYQKDGFAKEAVLEIKNMPVLHWESQN